MQERKKDQENSYFLYVENNALTEEKLLKYSFNILQRLQPAKHLPPAEGFEFWPVLFLALPYKPGFSEDHIYGAKTIS